MSLLLDALKKAEESKRLAATAPAASPPPEPTTEPKNEPGKPELSLEPVSRQQSTPLPDLAAHLDNVNDDLASVQTAPVKSKPPPEAKRPQPPIPPVTPNKAKEAARNVFAAKSVTPASRTPLWLGLATASVVAIGIGIWFWWQLQAVGGSTLSAPSPKSTPLPQQTATAAIPPIAAAPAMPTRAREEQDISATQSNDLSKPESSDRMSAPSVPRAPESPIRISRGEWRINPAIASGYEKLQANDLAGAAKFYEQALRTDPKNTDALLGMATLALKQGQLGSAETWYIKVLESDPTNVNAQAGLINLRGQADPVAAESRLKGLLAANPASAPLNFALGNLYAGQRRWPDAQLAYFNAHSAAPENPDYLFNLASSLDHMNLPKVALDYYKAALAVSKQQQAGFDTEQVKARILELQR